MSKIEFIRILPWRAIALLRTCSNYAERSRIFVQVSAIFVQASAIELAHIAERSRKCQEIGLAHIAERSRKSQSKNHEVKQVNE